ncbi:MAG: hypothetical protein KDG49_08030, partial [Geminicoccaceae bacterium]|nr:hypothetical protein [Geminicoccaceae bacterium]
SATFVIMVLQYPRQPTPIVADIATISGFLLHKMHQPEVLEAFHATGRASGRPHSFASRRVAIC